MEKIIRTLGKLFSSLITINIFIINGNNNDVKK